MVCVTFTAYLSVCDSASNIQHKRSQTGFPVESADAHNINGLQTEAMVNLK